MSIDIFAELEKVGAVYTEEHFVYTTGKHGSAYINFDPLFPNTTLVRSICEQLVAPYAGEVDTVVGPATGGIVLASFGADALSRQGYNISLAWPDKSGKEFVFERVGFEQHIQDRRVLIVEDLLNTGGSVEKVARLVEAHNGILIGASVIVNRGQSTAKSLRVPKLTTLGTVVMQAYDPEKCPLCDNSVPIVANIGHGNEYRLQHSHYKGGFKTLV